MTLPGYYRFHAPIYDATRWSFLFGRRALLDQLAERLDPLRVLEVGCGTGTNLSYLASRLARAHFVGVDLSADMLARATTRLRTHDSRVKLIRGRYPDCIERSTRFDLILFSYSLSMFDAEFPSALSAARAQLATSGIVAVVDFHDSALPGFKRWMKLNHVSVDARLLAALQSRFGTRRLSVRPAFLGVWSYFTFLGDGRKRTIPIV